MKKLVVVLAAMFMGACQAAVPYGYDVGYNNPPPSDTWQEPYDAGQPDTYVPPDTTDGSDATDSADTYVPPKDVTVEPDSSGPKEGDPCDDGKPCTEGTCWHANADGEFECNGGEVRTCADGKFCTTDECEAETGDCLHFERDCGDGNYCDDDADKCVEVVVVPDCDDEVPCTVDAIVDGNCSHTAKNALCDDGDLCTDNTCDGKKCVAVAKVCDDGNACTNDTCEGDSGCATSPKCVDGDVCESGVCKEPVVEPQPGESCNDNDPCTVTDRIKQNGECHGVQKECLDNSKCTQDGCVSGTCVNEPVQCADGKECSASTGQCVVVGPQVGDACNDFDSCTVNDEIIVGGACVGVAKNCNDDKACTADSCVSGQCSNVPVCACSIGGQCATDPEPPANPLSLVEIAVQVTKKSSANIYSLEVNGYTCASGQLETDPAKKAAGWAINEFSCENYEDLEDPYGSGDRTYTDWGINSTTPLLIEGWKEFEIPVFGNDITYFILFIEYKVAASSFQKFYFPTPWENPGIQSVDVLMANTGTGSVDCVEVTNGSQGLNYLCTYTPPN
ncbi:MAG: hypothetical protein AAB384_01555 [Patescibacteria group bacterium]